MEPSLHLPSFLNAHPKVQFVRLCWLDLSGVLRCRIFTKEHCLEVAKARKALSLAPLSMTCLVDGTPLDTYQASGVDSLWPDWPSLRMTNFNPRQLPELRYATVMCTLSESSPLHPTMATRRCPRHTLYRVLDEADQRFNLKFLIGFEIEFIFIQRATNNDVLPVDINNGRNAVAGCQVPSFRFVEEAVDELEKIGVKVQQFHSEGFFGQYEISTGPLDPMTAVDTFLCTRDAIKNVCAQHGIVATMHPKPMDTHPATANHTHYSMTPSEYEEFFAAGILGRLPALCAFSMANLDSYQRRVEAGQWVCWGTQSRDVPLRKISPGHWEIRCVDTTSNTYLFLAAFIGAGLLGIQNKEPLIWKDSKGWSSEYSTKELADLNMSTPMPESLMDALEALQKRDHGLDQVLGEEILSQYTYLKLKESRIVQEWGLRKRRKIYSGFF